MSPVLREKMKKLLTSQTHLFLKPGKIAGLSGVLSFRE
jgi:hypothetical protein